MFWQPGELPGGWEPSAQQPSGPASVSLVVLPGTVLSKEGVAILLGLEQKCGEEGRSVIYLPMSDGGIRGPGPFQAPDSSFTFSVKRRMLLLHWMSFKTSTGKWGNYITFQMLFERENCGYQMIIVLDIVFIFC